jgi:hypothetical protein
VDKVPFNMALDAGDLKFLHLADRYAGFARITAVPHFRFCLPEKDENGTCRQ